MSRRDALERFWRNTAEARAELHRTNPVAAERLRQAYAEECAALEMAPSLTERAQSEG